MKKLLLPLFCLFFIVLLGQVGINTSRPQGILHIDGKGDNPEVPVPLTEQIDDFIVTSEGKIGIGTIEPELKLEIRTEGTAAVPQPAIKIVDGSQADGKVLTSDANGRAYWEYTSLYRIQGNLGAGIDIPFNATNINNWYDTGGSITLGPGKWEVKVTMLMAVNTIIATGWCWLRSSFFDEPGGTTASTDIEGTALVGGLFSGPLTTANTTKFDIMMGSIIINNKSAQNKTYYYKAGYTSFEGVAGTTVFRGFGSSTSGENSIIATPIL